jgi:hydrogenase nickel incorporation protein HypA/HybF
LRAGRPVHELAITQSLLQVALDKAGEAKARRIGSIRLRIGRLSGYVPEAVEQNFRMITPGTIAEGAALEIDWVPLRCRCKGCGVEYDATPDDFTCPACRAADFAIISGREMFIESMEVET